MKTSRTTSGRTTRFLTTGAALLIAAQMTAISGCGKEEPPPPPPPKRAPPPPPPPERIELAPLMRGIDARVQFPAGKAPYDASLAEAVISFAAAFASGDDAALGGMLDLSSRGILDSMLADGTWFDSTDEIEAVRVSYMGQDPDGADEAGYGEFVLAIQEPGGAFTLGWTAENTGGGWVMSPLSTVDLTLARAADWDADSIGAYESDQGWGSTDASQGFALPVGDAPSPQGSSNASSTTRVITDEEYARLLQQEPIFVYMDVESTKTLLAVQLAATPNPEEVVFEAIAQTAGVNSTRVRSLYQEGKRAANADRLPDAIDYKHYFDFGMNQVKEVLATPEAAFLPDDLPKSEGDWMAFMADLLGVNTSALQALYDAAP